MAGDLTFNKYAAAILATALGFMLIKEISHGAMHVEKTEGLAYCNECVPPEDSGPKEKPLPFPQAEWIAGLDAERGEKLFQACSTCHTVNKGGDNLQGPNLWNVVNRPSGSIDYAYSPGMKAMGIDWGYEELDTFLTKPARYVKNTKMGWGGEKKIAKRAALISYLNTLSDNPATLPATAAAAPAENIEDISAPVDGEKPMAVESGKDEMTAPVEAATEKAAEMTVDVKDSAESAMEKVSEGAEGTMDKAAEMAGEVKDGAKVMAEDIKDAAEAEMVDKIKPAVPGFIDEGDDMMTPPDIKDKVEEIVPPKKEPVSDE